jgi:hypothetical protein
MNNTKRAGSSHRIKSSAILTLLTLLLLGGVNQAQAQWTAPDSNGRTNYPNGNVGIGTTTPASKLEVEGNILQKSNNPEIDFTSTYTSGGSFAIGTGWSAAGYNKLYVYDNINTATRMVLDSSGNFGIGTTSPAQKLDLGGSIAIYGATVINNNRVFSARSTYNAYTADGVWSTQATPSTIFTPSSYVSTGFIFGYEDEGYGQYTPSLGISTPPNASVNTRVLQLRQFGGTSPETYNRFEMNVSGKLSWGGGTAAPDASITRSGTSTLAVTGTLNVSGNVGVGGNANPTYKLDVSGAAHVTSDLTVDGNIKAKFQDVAEWVPSVHPLPAGTVVVLNPNKSNEVMPSEKAYDTGVAGVVSAKPGLTLGEAGTDKSLVATTGRVKVKVDATKSPIHVGDLLVTSDEEGVAMKSEPVDVGGVKLHRPGTLIGKALEPLEHDKGEILVLLSLQ